MAIPAIIAANPQLALSVGSLLAKLGSGFLGRNDAKDAMKKAEEENEKIMRRANLRQSFGGNPSVDLVQPKLDQGFGTTLLSKLGDAAGLASQAYGLHDAKKLRDLQKLNIQGQMDSRQLTDDITRGATLGAGSILPQTSISTAAPKLAGAVPPPVASAAPKLAGAVPPPVASKLAGAAPPPVMSDDTLSTLGGNRVADLALSSMPSELFPASKLAAMPSELFPASREADTLSTLSSMPSELFPETKLAAMPSELFPASREANTLAALGSIPSESLVNTQDTAIQMPETIVTANRPQLKSSMPSESLASRGATPLSDLTGPSGAGSRVAPGSFELGGSVAPGDLSDVGKAAFRTAQNERIAARGAAQGAAQQQAFENNQVLSDRFLREQDLSLKTRIFEGKMANLGKLPQKDRLAAEKTLRTDFNKLTGEFRDVGNSFNTILAGAENPTAVSDMSLIFSFMKMLDPGSVVRESEFDQAESAAGWSDSALNAMNKFWDGTKLTTNRGEFLTQAKNLYDARMPGYTNILDTYTGIAGRENLDARNVVMDYTVNLDRFDEILKKSQAQTTTGSGDTHEDVLSFLETYEPGRMKPGQGVYRREFQ